MNDPHNDPRRKGLPQQQATPPGATGLPVRPIAVALALLDISTAGFYALWFIANDWAVERAEEHGFDRQQLLPHGNLFWLAAQATLLCLVVLNVLLIARWQHDRHARRQQERP